MPSVTDIRHSGNKPGQPVLANRVTARDLPPLPPRPKLRAPEGLTKPERRLWKRVVRASGEEWFTSADSGLLLMYVRSYLEWEKWNLFVRRTMEKCGPETCLSDPFTKAIDREAKLSSRILALEKQLGLTLNPERRLGSRKTENMVSAAEDAQSDIDDLAAMRARAAEAMGASVGD